MSDRFFYLGEFGYLNFSILGLLEKFLNENPSRNLEILTYDDYYWLMDYLFPGRISRISADLSFLKSQRDIKRRGYSLSVKGLPTFLKGNKTTSLATFLKGQGFDFDQHRGAAPLVPLKTPVLVPGPQLDQPIVSFVCRKRAHDRSRNLSPTLWKRVFFLVRGVFPRARFVFHGLSNETQELPDQEIYFCSSLKDSAYFLNQSKLLITSMSGFAQFAANCRCPLVQIGLAKDYFVYSPFKTPHHFVYQRKLSQLEFILSSL